MRYNACLASGDMNRSTEPLCLFLYGCSGVGADLMSISSALLMPTIYGDERDAIIAKWNQLQAFWGTGSGYINQNSCVPFTQDNPFCRFKVTSLLAKEAF